MNKLGFYVEKTTDPLLRDALQKVKPPVVVIHAQDRGLLLDIRKHLSPDTFVIGRLFKNQSEQEAMLDNDHPEESGRKFADEILSYDFKLALERGVDDRLLIDAWMSLNELPPGPASYPGFRVDGQYQRRAEHYDRFQDAFRQRLESEGVDAVAFNFAAGNYIYPEHYLEWFPRTLENYSYLGFHEYGWPSLRPEGNGHTSALFYRNCMEGIRRAYGSRHQVIITEAGLTMAYGQPANPDRGWLNYIEPLTEEQYWQSLSWYNDELLKDDYVLGACLFQVGHTGRWETFRHFGVDNDSNAISLISRISELGPSPPRPPAPEPETPTPNSLEARVEILETTLVDSLALVEELPESVQTIESKIPELEPAVEHVQTVALITTKLHSRLDYVKTSLSNLQENGKATTEDLDSLLDTASNLDKQLLTMRPHLETMNQAASQLESIREALPDQLRQVKSAALLTGKLQSLLDQTLDLKAEFPADQALAQFTPPSARLRIQPDLFDVREQLPQHPSKRFHLRDREDIETIVVHQSGTSPITSAHALAQVQIYRHEAPGITYHFFIHGNGDVYWTQSLEQVLQSTLRYETNASSVAVALAGDFNYEAPPPAQLMAAADVIAWLISELNLGVEDVIGRSELEPVLSPGSQWKQGARYRNTLLGLVRARLMTG